MKPPKPEPAVGRMVLLREKNQEEEIVQSPSESFFVHNFKRPQKISGEEDGGDDDEDITLSHFKMHQ